jgi:hypothetical protein
MVKLSRGDRDILRIYSQEYLSELETGPHYSVYYPGFSEENDVSYDLSKPIQDFLKINLDRGGLTGFISSEAAHFLSQSETYDPQHRGLGTLSEYINVRDASNEFANIFVQLPFNYKLMWRSGNIFSGLSLKKMKIDFSQSFSIISSDLLPQQNLNMTSKFKDTTHRINSELNDEDLLSLPTEGVYFLGSDSGYIDGGYDSDLFHVFLDNCKAFYGAGIALGMWHYIGFMGGNETKFVLSFEQREKNSSFYLGHLHTPDRDLNSLYNEIFLTKRRRETWHSDSPDLYSDIERLKPVFCGEHSQKLRTSSIWFLRSHSSENLIDKLLFAIISLEVMLGDRQESDRVGLTSLLANRGAYMIRRSAKERSDVLKLFKDLYSLRSKVMHSGTMTASKGENFLINKGLVLIGEVLAHEISFAHEV